MEFERLEGLYFGTWLMDKLFKKIWTDDECGLASKKPLINLYFKIPEEKRLFVLCKSKKKKWYSFSGTNL